MKTKGHIITDEQFEEYNRLIEESIINTRSFSYLVHDNHFIGSTSRYWISIKCNDSKMLEAIEKKLLSEIKVEKSVIGNEIANYKKYYQLSLDAKKRVDKLMKSTTIWRFLRNRRRFNKTK